MVLGYMVLILALLVVWALGFRLGGYELFAPISAMPLAMLLGAILAAIGITSWNSVSLGPTTTAIIVLGTLSFVIGCVFCSEVMLGRGRAFRGFMYERTTLDFGAKSDNVKYWILLVLVIVIAVLHMCEIMKLGGSSDWTQFTEVAKRVRYSTSSVFSSQGISLEDGFPIYDRILSKIRAGIGVVSAAAIPYELVVRRRSVGQVLPVILTFLVAAAMSLVSGGRGGVVNLALIMFLSLSLSWQWRDGARRTSWRTACCCLFGGVGLAVLFYGMGFVVSRIPSGGVVEYLTFYLGAGVPSLEMVLDAPLADNGLIGFNTFHDQYYLLAKLGLMKNVPAYGSQFFDLGGHASNVFTFAYRYYIDFGMLGVILLSGLSGICFTFLYRLASENMHRPAIFFCYCTIGVLLFDIMRDEKLFAAVLTANTVVTLALAAVISLWLYDPRTSITKRMLSAAPWIEEAA